MIPSLTWFCSSTGKLIVSYFLFNIMSDLKMWLYIFRFTPDVAKYELLISDDLALILEQHVSIAIHPLLEHLLKTSQFVNALQKLSTGCQPDTRLNLLRLVGHLLTPDYQQYISEHFVCLLTIFLQNVDLGNYHLHKWIIMWPLNCNLFF